MGLSESRPRLSVAIVCYEMAEQIENTLRSLLPPYQREVTLEDYEIILVDNGSAQPLPEVLQHYSSNLRYLYLRPDEARPSPATAMNKAAGLARARWLCLMIDGARILTPGVFSWAMRLLALAPESAVEVRGWHLGPKFQPESVAEGYDSAVEKQLLERVRWWEHGYRLFEVAAPSAQTIHGVAAPAAESNCFFISRQLFDRIGGFDERYEEPGGGHLNHDFYSRAVSAARQVWTLLGEGTFHQVHGGAATSLSPAALREAGARWRAEFTRLHGDKPPLAREKFILAGHLPPEFQASMNRNRSRS